MQSNYRHHYPLTATTSASQLSSSMSSSSTVTSPNKSRHQQQVAMASGYNNGLPVAGARVQQSQILPSNYPLLSKQQHLQFQNKQQVSAKEFAVSEQLNNGQRYNARHFIDTQQQQHQHQHQHYQFQHQHQHQQQQQLLQHQMKETTGKSEYCSNLRGGSPIEVANQNKSAKQVYNGSNNNNNNQQQQQQSISSKQRDFLHQQYDYGKHNDDQSAPMNNNGVQQINQHLQDNYTSQIRNSQLQHRFQQTQANHQNSHFLPASRAQTSAQMQHQTARGSCSAGGSKRSVATRPKSPTCSSSASSSPAGFEAGQASNGSSTRKSPPANKEVHVNFNRSNQALGAGEEEGDSRKKKYLTAKYGQQQMNLIKKRLKIEMWLYEQLQDLAKGSGSEVSRLLYICHTLLFSVISLM